LDGALFDTIHVFRRYQVECIAADSSPLGILHCEIWRKVCVFLLAFGHRQSIRSCELSLNDLAMMMQIVNCNPRASCFKLWRSRVIALRAAAIDKLFLLMHEPILHFVAES
jgi:hypothetical protein